MLVIHLQKKEVTYHVAAAACVLGNDRNAVYNGLLFVRGAAERMYCITYIVALCFDEELNVPGVSTGERKRR